MNGSPIGPMVVLLLAFLVHLHPANCVSFPVRSYDGTNNNVDFSKWGSVGSNQLRSIAWADYEDGISSPPGSSRPTARKVLSEVFLAAPTSGSPSSALFPAWAMLLGFDQVLTNDNSSESLDIYCEDGAADIWCPFGSLSDPISFNRSESSLGGSGDSNARAPINYATAYFDLDFVYGRDQESANELRAMEGGLMTLGDNGMPMELSNGLWLLADQRTASYPVTFALHTVLL
ncbi:unnamed protein product, partial [Choristocarpus tenellus]